MYGIPNSGFVFCTCRTQDALECLHRAVEMLIEEHTDTSYIVEPSTLAIDPRPLFLSAVMHKSSMDLFI
jgi:hypothetical protein